MEHKLFNPTDNETGPAKLTPAEAQKIVNFFEIIDTESTKIKISPEIAFRIFEYFNKGLVTGLTTGIMEIMLDKIRKLPTDKFNEIVQVLNVKDIEKHTFHKGKIESLEKQKNFHRCLFVIKRKLLQVVTLNGWILLDEFAIRSYNSLAITLFKIPEKLCKILNKERNHFNGPNRIYDIEKDEFLKNNDPNSEVKVFVKNVIKAINNYNHTNGNKERLACFGDKSYYLFVIHRYPHDTQENIMINQILIEKEITNGRFKIA